MNRLTKCNGHYCDDCGYEPGEFCACNEEIAMYERLKQYEDAEEQGRLVEVRHGRWINDRGLYCCTACGELWTIGWATCISLEQMNKNCPYCPQCGAKMDEGQEE